MQKFFGIGLVLIATTGVLFASGGRDRADAPVIEVTHGASDEMRVGIYQAVFQQLVDEYNTQNGTDYVLNFVAGQGKDITNTRMSSNDKPDIFSLDSPADVNQYAKDGLLLDLTPYAAAARWEDTLFGWAYDFAKVNQRVVTLPYGYEGMVLWYNKAIMNELGLNPADIGTLDAFEAAMKTAADAGYIPVMLGTQDQPWSQEWYLSILYSYTGRDLLKATIEGRESWNDAAFRRTVELYRSWHDKGFLADGKSYVLTIDDAINAFSNDKALFKVEGTWAPYWILPLDAQAQDKIGVMLHPAINASERPHMPLAVGSMWCISRDTQHADLAAYILSGLLRQEFQGPFLQNGMDVAPMEIDTVQFSGLAPVVESMWSIVNGALAEGSFGYTTWAFVPPETRVYLYEGIVSVLEEDITVDEYLAQMQRLNTKELNAGFNPVIPAATN